MHVISQSLLVEMHGGCFVQVNFNHEQRIQTESFTSEESIKVN